MDFLPLRSLPHGLTLGVVLREVQHHDCHREGRNDKQRKAIVPPQSVIRQGLTNGDLHAVDGIVETTTCYGILIRSP